MTTARIGAHTVPELQARIQDLKDTAASTKRSDLPAVREQIEQLVQVVTNEATRDRQLTRTAEKLYDSAESMANERYDELLGEAKVRRAEEHGWLRHFFPLPRAELRALANREAGIEEKSEIRGRHQGEVRGDERALTSVRALLDDVCLAEKTLATIQGSANGYALRMRVTEEADGIRISGSSNGYSARMNIVQPDADHVEVQGSHNGYALRMNIERRDDRHVDVTGSHNGYSLRMAIEESDDGGLSVRGSHNGYGLNFNIARSESGSTLTGSLNGYSLRMSLERGNDKVTINGSMNGYSFRATYEGDAIQGSANGYSLRGDGGSTMRGSANGYSLSSTVTGELPESDSFSLTPGSEPSTGAVASDLMRALAFPLPMVEGNDDDLLRVALWAVLSSPEDDD